MAWVHPGIPETEATAAQIIRMLPAKVEAAQMALVGARSGWNVLEPRWMLQRLWLREAADGGQGPPSSTVCRILF